MVQPILLLGMVPTLNSHVMRQFVGNMLVVSFSVLIIQGMFGDKPVPMTIMVMAMFALLFREMSRGPNFLFGAMSIVNMSMQLLCANFPPACRQ